MCQQWRLGVGGGRRLQKDAERRQEGWGRGNAEGDRVSATPPLPSIGRAPGLVGGWGGRNPMVPPALMRGVYMALHGGEGHTEGKDGHFSVAAVVAALVAAVVGASAGGCGYGGCGSSRTTDDVRVFRGHQSWALSLLARALGEGRTSTRPTCSLASFLQPMYAPCDKRHPPPRTRSSPPSSPMESLPTSILAVGVWQTSEGVLSPAPCQQRPQRRVSIATRKD